MTMLLVVLANAVIGLSIGLTGFAGFLLPMFYAGFLGLHPVESLALSFAAFLVSGSLGCPAYRKTGDLPFKPCAALLVGSAIGAVAGTRIGLLLPADMLTVILYVVVLVSGASVLIQLVTSLAHRNRDDIRNASQSVKNIGHVALFVIGLLTAVVCAASGAGGPVLVIPLLLAFGVPARRAVAMSLIDSVVIAIPATIGYFASGMIAASTWVLLPAALIAHGVGTLVGAANAHRINALQLKTIVAVGAVAIAIYKLVATVV